MEYHITTKAEAIRLQDENMHLIGRCFKATDSDLRYEIVAVMPLPAPEDIFDLMANLIKDYYIGADVLGEIQAIANNYTEDEFTVVLFGRTNSLSAPSVAYSSLNQVVNDKGELSVAFPLLEL